MKTDVQLQRDVMAELAWEPAVHAAQIGVEVRDGVVTLAGEASSYAEKRMAMQTAQRVPGVQALAVEMSVKPSQLGQRADADIALAARNILAWTSALPADGVQVLVDHGWLTLSGPVEWQYQRELAEQVVGHLPGVTGVSNQISIEPALSAAVVRGDIESALMRRAGADAETIAVAVDGGDVTLSGTVHGWDERELAIRTAWRASGVRRVIDDLNLIH